MKYLDNAKAVIRWDEEIKAAIIEWKGYAEGEEYRAILNLLLDVMVKHRATKLLADTQRMKVLTQEDQTWVSMEWGPKAVAAGLKWNALLVPASAVAKLTLSRMNPTFPPVPGSRSIESSVVYFGSLEEARAWLRSIH